MFVIYIIYSVESLIFIIQNNNNVVIKPKVFFFLNFIYLCLYNDFYDLLIIYRLIMCDYILWVCGIYLAKDVSSHAVTVDLYKR